MSAPLPPRRHRQTYAGCQQDGILGAEEARWVEDEEPLMVHPCDTGGQLPGMKWLLEYGLEFGGALSNGDGETSARFLSDTSRSGYGGGGGGAEAGGRRLRSCDDRVDPRPPPVAVDAPQVCATPSPSPPALGTEKENLSAVGVKEEPRTAAPRSTVVAAVTSVGSVVATEGGGGRDPPAAGGGSSAPLRAPPPPTTGGGEEDALPPEARPPWEVAVAFELVACENVLPSPAPRRRKRKAAAGAAAIVGAAAATAAAAGGAAGARGGFAVAGRKRAPKGAGGRRRGPASFPR